jgi:hypothetical protein
MNSVRNASRTMGILKRDRGWLALGICLELPHLGTRRIGAPIPFVS